MVMRLKELEALSDEELAAAYDKEAKNVVVGLDLYRNEIIRRENSRQNKRIEEFTASTERLTRWITRMTVVIMALTAVNVVVAIIPLFRKC
jgi:hypothetical protein